MQTGPISLRVMRAAWRTLHNQFGWNAGWLHGIAALMRFRSEYDHYRTLNQGSAFTLAGGDVFPCLTDNTGTTPLEPTYFLQDAWFARLIAGRRPTTHVDVGSSVRTMSIVAQFIPVTLVDIRPVDLQPGNFTFLGGTILALPFSDRSVASLSSLCVIEHIGLGRYGDPLDACGSEKAAAELQRVLAPGGDLYLSVPVDDACRIYFNAHRAFTRDYLLSLLPELRLESEAYIYGREYANCYDPARGFGTGLFHLRRP